MIFDSSLEISEQYEAQLGYPPISWPFGLMSGLYASYVVLQIHLKILTLALFGSF